MTSVLVPALLRWAALDPGADQARRLLGHELSRAQYQESLVARVGRWFRETLSGLPTVGIGGVGAVAGIVLLLVLAALAVALLSRLGRDAQPTGAPSEVFADHRLRAVDHRRRAELALAEGRWTDAVLDSVRGLAADLVERGLLAEQDTETVRATVEGTAAMFPDRRESLLRAGLLFDAARYDAQPAGPEQAAQVLALAEDLRSVSPRRATGAPSSAVAPR